MQLNYPSPDAGILLYWRNEQSGTLCKAVQAFTEYFYGKQGDFSSEQFEMIKTYFTHWADSHCWSPEYQQELDYLRKTIREAKTAEDLDRWLDNAIELGIDPL